MSISNQTLREKITARKAQTMYTIEWVDEYDDSYMATEDFDKAYAKFCEVVSTSKPYGQGKGRFDVVVKMRSMNAYEYDHMTIDSTYVTLYQTTVTD